MRRALRTPQPDSTTPVSPRAVGSVQRGIGPGRASSDDDGSVIDALRRGDDSAFARLIDRYGASLCRVACRYVSNRAVADEVVQDTWLGVIQGISGFECRSSLKTWIFHILVNRAKTRAVREGRRVPMARLDEEEVQAATPLAPDYFPADGPAKPGRFTRVEAGLDASPERRLLGRETWAHLQKAIEALPEHQRLVLILRDVEGCSTKEVGNALGFQDVNTRVLLHRARAKVRVALRPYLDGAEAYRNDARLRWTNQQDAPGR
jgi:RNA polymerase sigma-70 factor, ECF subfamily